MAFLGAGYTHLGGQHGSTVENAIDWMVSEQDADGSIGKGFQRGFGYHHAICGLALAESYGMTKDPHVGSAAQKAVNYSVTVHQCPGSGWRYVARQAPCTSVTGWFVQQLAQAKAAGLNVPASGFQGAANWLDKVTTADGRFSYQQGRQPSIVMTAVGVLCRQLTGWRSRVPRLRGGVEWLMIQLPSWNNINFYYWYFATMAMFQTGDRYWDSWNEALAGTLIEHQRRGGDEEGSWDPVGHWCGAGGRVMSTALGALCLEAPYRYERAGR